MSLAGVSFANVTMADIDLRSVDPADPGPEGGTMRTASTVKLGGSKLLMTAGEVPGGKDDSCSVGLGAALSAALPAPALSSSSSETLNTAAVSTGAGSS